MVDRHNGQFSKTLRHMQKKKTTKISAKRLECLQNLIIYVFFTFKTIVLWKLIVWQTIKILKLLRGHTLINK